MHGSPQLDAADVVERPDHDHGLADHAIDRHEAEPYRESSELLRLSPITNSFPSGTFVGGKRAVRSSR